MKKLLIIFLMIISTPAAALLTSDMQNMCGLTDINIYAVFELAPTIDITYDYGDGNTENATCTYDTEFILPEPPTRVGYTFTGWKVKTSE